MEKYFYNYREMLKPQERILRCPSDSNSGIGGFASAFAELARAVTDDLESRQLYLDSCDWLTPEQKEKIKITPEYIEIDGIKLKLYDEPGEVDNEGRMFRGDIQLYTLSNDKWENILKFIGGESSQQFGFFYNVLGMKKTQYVTATEPEDDRYANECILNIDQLEGITITEGFSEGPENWTWGRFKYSD